MSIRNKQDNYSKEAAEHLKTDVFDAELNLERIKKWLLSSKLQSPPIVVVIIPMVGLSSTTESLFNLFSTIYSQPRPNLAFVLLTPSNADGVFNDEHFPFPDRLDVAIIAHTEPQNFIAAFQQLLEKLPQTADIVLLDPSTNFYADAFEALQYDAYANIDVSTASPLDNNVLFENTNIDGCLPTGFSINNISDALRDLQIPYIQNKHVNKRFSCLYIKRGALNSIDISAIANQGFQDFLCSLQKTFAEVGWKSIISCKTYMHNNKTFFISGSGSKDIENDLLTSGPAKFHCIAITLYALRAYIKPQSTVLYTLQANPDSASAAGTERHVRHLSSLLLNKGHAVLTLYPARGKQFIIKGKYGNSLFLNESFSSIALPFVLEMLEPYVDVLHVHHTLRWDDDSLRLLLQANFRDKLLSLHDYYSACPSVNLIRVDDKKFCAVEDDLEKCNGCLRRQNTNINDIRLYREKSSLVFNNFRTILAPSPSVKEYMIKAFPKHRNLLEEKMRIYPHDLSHLFFEGTSQKQNLAPTENTLVFIGAIGEIKGAPLIYESIPALLKEGFSIKILGKIHPYSPQKLKHVELLPYKNLEQLKSLLSALNPRFVAFPSVCAETFCYAFYEALVYAPGAVPIVGPYGNPAQVTQKHGIGVVMSEPSSSALLESCSIARQNYPALIKVKSAFVESLASQENDYYKDYSSMLLIANRASEPTLPTTQGAKILLESLNRIDEAGRIALGEFQELSLIHKKPFVQFAVRLHCFIKGVERQIRHFRKRIF